jgi:hypothetical protein
VIVLDRVLESAKVGVDVAVSDGLLAVVGVDGHVLNEIVRAIAWRAVEQLTEADLAAIVSESPQVLAAKAAPGGPWRDLRDPSDNHVTVADLVRAVLEAGIRGTLRDHLLARLHGVFGEAKPT